MEKGVEEGVEEVLTRGRPCVRVAKRGGSDCGRCERDWLQRGEYNASVAILTWRSLSARHYGEVIT